MDEFKMDFDVFKPLQSPALSLFTFIDSLHNEEMNNDNISIRLSSRMKTYDGNICKEKPISINELYSYLKEAILNDEMSKNILNWTSIDVNDYNPIELYNNSRYIYPQKLYVKEIDLVVLVSKNLFVTLDLMNFVSNK